MNEGHFIRIEDTGTPRPDLSVDQLWKLVQHWHEAWRDAASEQVKMRALLERVQRVTHYDIAQYDPSVGTAAWASGTEEERRAGRKQLLDEIGTLLAQSATGKGQEA